jgi:hypothetical protein
MAPAKPYLPQMRTSDRTKARCRDCGALLPGGLSPKNATGECAECGLLAIPEPRLSAPVKDVRFILLITVLVLIATQFSLIRDVVRWRMAQRWEVVPATILDVNLRSHMDSHTLELRFAYELSGQAYESTRCFLNTPSSEVQAASYDALKAGGSVSCYDPDDPESAVFDRRLSLMGLNAGMLFSLFIALFHCVGLICHQQARMALAELAEGKPHPDQPWLWEKSWRDKTYKRRDFVPSLHGYGYFGLLAWPMLCAFGDVHDRDAIWLGLAAFAGAYLLYGWLCRKAAKPQPESKLALELASPFSLGGHIHGSVRAAGAAPASVEVTLYVKVTGEFPRLATTTKGKVKDGVITLGSRVASQTLKPARVDGQWQADFEMAVPLPNPETVPGASGSYVAWTLACDVGGKMHDFSVPVFRARDDSGRALMPSPPAETAKAYPTRGDKIVNGVTMGCGWLFGLAAFGLFVVLPLFFVNDMLSDSDSGTAWTKTPARLLSIDRDSEGNRVVRFEYEVDGERRQSTRLGDLPNLGLHENTWLSWHLRLDDLTAYRDPSGRQAVLFATYYRQAIGEAIEVTSMVLLFVFVVLSILRTERRRSGRHLRYHVGCTLIAGSVLALNRVIFYWPTRSLDLMLGPILLHIVAFQILYLVSAFSCRYGWQRLLPAVLALSFSSVGFAQAWQLRSEELRTAQAAGQQVVEQIMAHIESTGEPPNRLTELGDLPGTGVPSHPEFYFYQTRHSKADQSNPWVLFCQHQSLFGTSSLCYCPRVPPKGGKVGSSWQIETHSIMQSLWELLWE